MRSRLDLRNVAPALAAVVAFGAPPAWSQTAIPPTSSTSTSTGAHPAAQNPSHHANVTFQDGLLKVVASDSSLNSILREIARQTGMRISGSVRDDRVFGEYGPAVPSTVLSTLLDGTGSNLLIVNTADDQPSQLILTPRLGAPTPPGQFASGRDTEADDNEPPRPFGQALPPNVPQQFQNRPQAGPGQNLTPPLSSPTTNNSDSQAVVFPSVSATTTPATATSSSDTTQQTPGGVKTPQQIFEQLQKLRQQQEQTDGTPVQ